MKRTDFPRTGKNALKIKKRQRKELTNARKKPIFEKPSSGRKG